VFQRGGRRPIRREVDHAPLTHAEDAVQATTHEQGQVGKGAERPVADQDVAGAQLRVQVSDAGHPMGPQGRDQKVLEQARPGVEQCQHAGDGKATPCGLVGGRTEGPLQVRRVGHAGAGAVDEPGAVTVPQSDRISQAPAGLDQAPQECLEDGQGQRERA
jgi:hypothetical protein